MSATAIIVAAGSGTRLGAGRPKAFVELGGIPLLVHSLRVLLAARGISAAVVVAPPDEQPVCAEMIARHGPWRCPIAQIGGGSRRQDSVRAGLSAIGDAQFVAVHDAARPFVTVGVVERVLALAAECGAAIVAVPVRDTVKQVHPDGWIESTPLREGLWLAQTPQAFRTEILCRAHDRALAEGVIGSDDAMLVEQLGVRVRVTPGNEENRKITTAEDLRWAEWFLSANRP